MLLTILPGIDTEALHSRPNVSLSSAPPEGLHQIRWREPAYNLILH